MWGTGTRHPRVPLRRRRRRGHRAGGRALDDPEPVNLGADHEVSIRETVEHIARLTGFTGELRWDPDPARRPAPPPGRRLPRRAAARLAGHDALRRGPAPARSTGTWPTATRPRPRRPTEAAQRAAALTQPLQRARGSRRGAGVPTAPQRRRCRARSWPGGAPGRGGSRSAVAIGRTSAGSSPAAASTAWANSYQLTAPWLVTWWTPGAAVDGQPAQHRRQVGGERRVAALVVDEGQLPVLGGQPQHVFTMLAPCSPHTHDVRTTVAPARRPRLLLAGQLRARRRPTAGAGSSHSVYGVGLSPSNT